MRKIDKDSYGKNPEKYRASLWLVPVERWRSWTMGPYKHFNVSNFLCEGSGGIYTKEDNKETGKIIIKALTELEN